MYFNNLTLLTFPLHPMDSIIHSLRSKNTLTKLSWLKTLPQYTTNACLRYDERIRIKKHQNPLNQGPTTEGKVFCLEIPRSKSTRAHLHFRFSCNVSLEPYIKIPSHIKINSTLFKVA